MLNLAKVGNHFETTLKQTSASYNSDKILELFQKIQTADDRIIEESKSDDQSSSLEGKSTEYSKEEQEMLMQLKELFAEGINETNFLAKICEKFGCKPFSQKCVQILQLLEKFTDFLVQETKKPVSKRALVISDSLQSNIKDIDALVKATYDAKKPVLEQQINEMCQNNPMALFSECYASGCHLCRHTHGHYREEMENKIVQVANNYKNKSLIYTTYYAGYFFQDIIILSRLKMNGNDNITINLIIDAKDYFELAGLGTISYDTFDKDDNLKRKAWCQLFTYRIIKIHEWLNAIGLNYKLYIYNGEYGYINDCSADANYKCDFFVGIDYYDDFYAIIAQFPKTAFKTTKTDGYIFSLRTDGLGSTSVVLQSKKNEEGKCKGFIEPECSEKSNDIICEIAIDGNTQEEIDLKRDSDLGYNKDGNYIERDGHIFKYRTRRVPELKTKPYAYGYLYRSDDQFNKMTMLKDKEKQVENDRFLYPVNELGSLKDI